MFERFDWNLVFSPILTLCFPFSRLKLPLVGWGRSLPSCFPWQCDDNTGSAWRSLAHSFIVNFSAQVPVAVYWHMFCGAQDWHKLEKLGPWRKASVPALGFCWVAGASGLGSFCLSRLLGQGGTSCECRGPRSSRALQSCSALLSVLCYMVSDIRLGLPILHPYILYED